MATSVINLDNLVDEVVTSNVGVAAANQAVLDAETARDEAEAAVGAAGTEKIGAETARDEAEGYRDEASVNATNAATNAGIADAKASEAVVLRDETDILKAETLSYRDDALAYLAAVNSKYDEFDDRWLGGRANDPISDNDGQVLQEAAMYWNVVDKLVKIWTGTVWTPIKDADGGLLIANNLADVVDTEEARANLGGVETSLELDVRDVGNRDRANHTGTQLAATISDFDNAVKTSETTTSLSVNANILTYTDEEGTETDIDLSTYLDDTNLARLVAGELDGTTGVATFTRDDTTTFTVDMSALFDDSNLVVSVAGKDGIVELDKTDVGLNNVDNTADVDKPLSNAAVSALDLKQDILTEGAFVDGDKVKLDSIEVGATADQTAEEIEGLYEGLADTNKYTDAEKISVDVSTGLNTVAQTLPSAVNEVKNRVDVADNAIAGNNSEIAGLVQSVLNLSKSTAKGQFGDDGTMRVELNGTYQALPVVVKVQSTDTSKFEINPDGSITVYEPGEYSFISTVTFEDMGADGDIGGVTFQIMDTTDDTVYYSESTSIEIGGYDRETIPFNSLVIAPDTLTYPVTANIRAKVTGVSAGDYDIIGLNSVISSTNNNGTITQEHSELVGRDSADSHTISAITGLQEELDKHDVVNGTSADSRYDKILSSLNVIDMEYTNGDLTTVRYEGDDGATIYYRDVMEYVDGNLVNVKHFYGTIDLITESGLTTLTYDVDDNLLTAEYTE